MYLDPAFGGMLLQIIVVIAATGAVTLFSARKKIKKLFSKTDDTVVKAAAKHQKGDVVDALEPSSEEQA